MIGPVATTGVVLVVPEANPIAPPPSPASLTPRAVPWGRPGPGRLRPHPGPHGGRLHGGPGGPGGGGAVLRARQRAAAGAAGLGPARSPGEGVGEGNCLDVVC